MNQSIHARVASVVVLWAIFSVGVALVCVNTPGPPKTDPQIIKWVRTSSGWERSLWVVKPEHVEANLHPFVLAGFTAVASILGLLLFPSEPERNAAARKSTPPTSRPKTASSAKLCL